jgi:hypothetical protein
MVRYFGLVMVVGFLEFKQYGQKVRLIDNWVDQQLV